MTDTALLQLLSLDIPVVEHPERGFLEIAGIAHHENVNSSVYAYFLDQSNYPELAAGFLDSLLELIDEKLDKKVELGSYQVKTEEVTIKNNRIDIALNDFSSNSSVVIENKIYHHLDNDLQDYWEHFAYPEEQKVGVLLTLYPHVVPREVKGKFVNVTHQEWVSRIQSNGVPSRLPAKMYTYLNDFFKPFNLTKSTIMNDQAKFYFQHAKQIIRASETLKEGRAFVEDQIVQLAEKLDWKVYGNAYNWKNIWDKENHLDTYYTIWYDPLLRGEGKVTLIIELFREDVKREKDLRELLKGNEQFSKMRTGERGKKYAHFACRQYHLSMDEIERLSDTLYTLIQKDFAEVMELILKNNYPDRQLNWQQ